MGMGSTARGDIEGTPDCQCGGREASGGRLAAQGRPARPDVFCGGRDRVRYHVREGRMMGVRRDMRMRASIHPRHTPACRQTARTYRAAADRCGFRGSQPSDPKPSARLSSSSDDTAGHTHRINAGRLPVAQAQGDAPNGVRHGTSPRPHTRLLPSAQ